MALTRIIYFSENGLGIRRRQAAIAELEALAVARNRIDGISGVLLHDEDWFLQALEGGAEAVNATFARIEKDRRHTNVRVISNKVAQTRLFGAWSMGFAERTLQNEKYFGDHWFGKGMNPPEMREKDMLALMQRVYEKVITAKVG